MAARTVRPGRVPHCADAGDWHQQVLRHTRTAAARLRRSVAPLLHAGSLCRTLTSRMRQRPRLRTGSTGPVCFTFAAAAARVAQVRVVDMCARARMRLCRLADTDRERQFLYDNMDEILKYFPRSTILPPARSPGIDAYVSSGAWQRVRRVAHCGARGRRTSWARTSFASFCAATDPVRQRCVGRLSFVC